MTQEIEYKETRGRPSEYTDELADEICTLVSNGANLNRLAKLAKFPHESVLRNWLVNHDTFSTKYALARKARADARSDRIDSYKRQMLKGRISSDIARVAIDAEKWQAGKENSRRYGDLTKVQHEGGVTLEALITASYAKEKEDQQTED